jgi:endonuclease YncB( thermonuclease family)
MKKLIGLGVVTFLFMSFTANAAELSDIEGHDYEYAIQYLYDNEVISGYHDGTFKPYDTVNRAELLRILVGGKGVAIADYWNYGNCFPDVNEEWFAPFVCYAKEQGWVDGYEDGTFKPSQTVNKAEAVKMLVNSQGYSLFAEIVDSSYTDVDEEGWYAPYMQAAYDRGLFGKEVGVYGIGDGMSRGEISGNIYRAMIWADTTILDFKEEGDGDDWRSTILTNKNMVSAEVLFDQFYRPLVLIKFDDEGALLFADITERNIDRSLGIFLHNEFISAPKVIDRIIGGEAHISGDFSESEAEVIVQVLNMGLNWKYGLVTNVVDGDTIDVEVDGEEMRIRLIGIDTPESVHPTKEVECFGIEASDMVKEELLGEMVGLQADETQGDVDGYGRYLRYVFVDGIYLFNKQLVEEGYAYEYTYDEDYIYKDEFVEAQAYAEENGYGLWAEGVCEADDVPLENISYICSSNSYNCDDFGTPDEAQVVFDYCMGEVGSDVHALDGDENGLACENL